MCDQTDWVSGPGVLGPVNSWGKAFYQSSNITYNVQGQISPMSSGTVDYTAWGKHIIDTDSKIMNHSIVAADFDGDSSMDLVGWKGLSNTLQFYKNDGSNNFSKVNSYSGPATGPNAYGWGGFIATDDFNKDGKPDVVVPVCDDNWQYGGLMWFENKGNFNFTSHLISSTPCFSVATGDIDNSGNISIVAGCYYDASSYPFGVCIYKNSGGGNFTLSQTLKVSAWRVRLDDMNNDGYKDLIIGDPFDSLIYIYLNNKNGTFPSSPSGTISIAGVDGLWTRDMDNDGYEDIIFGSQPPSSSAFSIYWYHNSGDGLNYTPHHTVHAAGDMKYGDGAYTEDFDMDGKADVVSSYQYLAWFRQIGPDNFTEYQIDNYGYPSSHWVIPFKLNRGTCTKSGTINLLVCYEGNFAWYENNMVGQFASSADLESSILKSVCSDSGETTTWLYFGYDVCNPSAGALTFQFRTGNTAGEVTSAQWSTPVSSVTATGSVRDSFSLASLATKGLFQYRVNCTGGSDAPIVYEVWVTYKCSPSGVDEKNVSSPFSWQIQNNEICYSLPEKANISISLYDITGRLAKKIDNGKQLPGAYRTSISSLNPGIYFVIFSNNGVKTTQKMVLVK